MATQKNTKKDPNKLNKIDVKRFWLGAVLSILGIAMLFTGMIIEPKGEIHATVIGAVGEIFVLSGALLGLDSYFSYKLRNFFQQQHNDNTSEEDK